MSYYISITCISDNIIRVKDITIMLRVTPLFGVTSKVTTESWYSLINMLLRRLFTSSHSWGIDDMWYYITIIPITIFLMISEALRP